MANPEHLARLKEGVEAWNTWRDKNLLTFPDLSGAHLVGANLRGADLGNVDFRSAEMSRADFVNANLSGANFEGAILTSSLFGNSNLTKANLREAFIEKSNFNQANLTGADLSGCRLIGSDFGNANLFGATLIQAVLYETSWFQAILTSASLARAELQWANFALCFVERTDFSGAFCGWTIFAGVDLSVSIGLERINHAGPSTVGVDTLVRSSGKIPLEFLRGAGVPDSFIEFAKSLVTNPIDFYSCFISYSTKDQEFATRLRADLQDKGVRCWFARDDMAGGKKIHEQIDEAIHLHDRLLLILSKDSINSEWVRTEIAKARKREVKEKRRVLSIQCAWSTLKR